jgi:hypothetical protein
MIHPNFNELKYNFAAIRYSRDFIGTRFNKYDDVVVILNLPTLQSWRRFPDALFFIRAFKTNKLFIHSWYY